MRNMSSQKCTVDEWNRAFSRRGGQIIGTGWLPCSGKRTLYNME